jgi:hypothetical protein
MMPQRDLKLEYEQALSYPRGLFIRELIERIGTAEGERDEFKRKLAIIFDQSCYSDSLGVVGSDFSVCRWCGGGSGPGGKPSFTHNADCLMDDSVLEQKVQGVWNHDTEVECYELTKELASQRTARQTAEGLLAEANAKIARMSAPVSDEEWDAEQSEWGEIGSITTKRGFNAIIASRISGGKP